MHERSPLSHACKTLIRRGGRDVHVGRLVGPDQHDHDNDVDRLRDRPRGAHHLWLRLRARSFAFSKISTFEYLYLIYLTFVADHYVRDRVIDAMQRLAWPVFQGECNFIHLYYI